MSCITCTLGIVLDTFSLAVVPQQVLDFLSKARCNWITEELFMLHVSRETHADTWLVHSRRHLIGPLTHALKRFKSGMVVCVICDKQIWSKCQVNQWNCSIFHSANRVEGIRSWLNIIKGNTLLYYAKGAIVNTVITFSSIACSPYALPHLIYHYS